MLPDAVQVADPFHVVRVANTALDECRRRVQNDTIGHRGRRPDPLYRARRLLTMAAERLPDHRRERLVGLLAAGDPSGEVKLTWHAKEVVRQIYDHTDPHWPRRGSTRSSATSPTARCRSRCAGSAAPSSGGVTRSWPGTAPTSRNGPTEAINNLVKRVKRVAVRDAPLPQLPHPGPALRRPTELDPPRHPHPTMKSKPFCVIVAPWDARVPLRNVQEAASHRPSHHDALRPGPPPVSTEAPLIRPAGPDPPGLQEVARHVDDEMRRVGAAVHGEKAVASE